MPKNSGLTLFTKTWPLKRGKTDKNEHEERKRPLTATLDKPTILDVRFMGKIDMSTVRKEFLNISNLCRLPLMLKTKDKNNGRPLSLLSTDTYKKTKKKRKKADPGDDSHEDDESSVIQSAKLKMGNNLNAINNINNNNRSRSRSRNSGSIINNKSVIDRLKHQSSLLAIKNSVNDANNNKTLKVPLRKPTLTIIQPGSTPLLVAEVTGKRLTSSSSSSTKLPSPCKTCGRPDLPERFHSHPATPSKTPPRKGAKDVICVEPLSTVGGSDNKVPVKSSVQKPVAIKYKSSKTNGGANLSADRARKTSPVKTNTSNGSSLPVPIATKSCSPKVKTTSSSVVRATSPLSERESVMGRKNDVVVTPSSRAGSAKRTLTCYICGREFGTASLGLHVPKCLQKWERENARLPPNMRRKPPIKPDGEVSRQEWNQLAWESSQATLVPCPKCARTFFPDRLEVHRRSCKVVQLPTSNKTSPSNDTLCSASSSSSSSTAAASSTTMSQSHVSPDPASSSSSGKPPPSVQCYICGKSFGTHSVKIHEKTCLKKWHVENESLPYDMRSPAPVRPSPVNSDAPHSPKAAHPGSSTASTATGHGISNKEDRPASGAKSPPFPCYLCGKLFAVGSIYIHEPQCLKTWKIENDKLPPAKRRPVPSKPDIKFTHSGKINFEDTSTAYWQSHLNQLVPCKVCSRTFNPDRVAVHERSCKGN